MQRSQPSQHFLLAHLFVCIQYRSDNVALVPSLVPTNRNGIRLFYATVNQSSRHPLQYNQIARSVRPRNKIARSLQTNNKIVYLCPLVWRLSCWDGEVEFKVELYNLWVVLCYDVHYCMVWATVWIAHQLGLLCDVCHMGMWIIGWHMTV